MFYERRLGLLVLMKLCLIYAINSYCQCKKYFAISYRLEQTQHMCEMRNKYFLYSYKHEIMVKSFMKAVDRNIIPLGKWLNFR